MIVMPDAGNQWYTDADDGSARYEDYILTDLQADVVKKYRTVNSRYGCAIAGLSMGGFGALEAGRMRSIFGPAGPGAHTWEYWDRRIREFLPLLVRKMTN